MKKGEIPTVGHTHLPAKISIAIARRINGLDLVLLYILGLKSAAASKEPSLVLHTVKVTVELY